MSSRRNINTRAYWTRVIDTNPERIIAQLDWMWAAQRGTRTRFEDDSEVCRTSLLQILFPYHSIISTKQNQSRGPLSRSFVWISSDVRADEYLTIPGYMARCS